MTKKQEVAVREDMALATMDMEAEAGGGFDEAGSESFAIPFVDIIQKGSPQCDPDKGGYRKDAKPGMILNSVSEELYSGEEGIVVCPAYYQHRFVEWVPRSAGGGFRGMYVPGDPVVLEALRRGRDEKGNFPLENGNHLTDTRYHFVVLVTEAGIEPALIPMKSTQIRKSKKWMSNMQKLKAVGKNGPFTLPQYSHLYRLTTVGEENAKGSWRGWAIERLRKLEANAEDVAIFQAAKDFKAQIAAGTAQVLPQDDDGEMEARDF